MSLKMLINIFLPILFLYLNTEERRKIRDKEYSKQKLMLSNVYEGNNKITELRTILQRESQNS
jgi:hypothetical protein